MADVTVKILQQIRDKLDTLDTKVDTLDTKVTQLDTKVTQLDTKVTKLDTKVTELDTKVDHMAGSIVTIVSLLGHMNDRLDTHDTLETRVDRCERDIAELKRAR